MEKEYFITIKGQKVPVTEEVYYAYKRPAWRERKRRQVREEKEISLDALMDSGMDFDDPNEKLIDDIVEDQIVLDTLVSVLSIEERSLAQALFFDGKVEQIVAMELNVSQKTVNKRKHQLIEKMKNILRK